MTTETPVEPSIAPGTGGEAPISPPKFNWNASIALFILRKIIRQGDPVHFDDYA